MKQIIRLIIVSILLLLSPQIIEAQTAFSNDRNYVLTRTPRIAISDVRSLSSLDCLQSVEYIDEWGRALQKVQIGITPLLKNLATYQEYDLMGNPNKAWLPVVFKGYKGHFLPLDSVRKRSIDTYDGEQYGYSLDVFENSPLHRLIVRYAPGVSWVGDPSGHKFSYDVISSTSICRYVVADGGNDTIVNIRLAGMYGVGELFVESEKDEDSKEIIIYTDKLGRRVLEEREGRHYTYYVYDDHSRLRAVLPPQLSDSLTTVGCMWSNVSSKLVRQYAYLYNYDGKGQCSHKYLPGTSWSYYYYDQSGELILTQDDNLRKKGECMFTIPDAHGRIALSGICRNSCSFAFNPLEDVIVRAVSDNQTHILKGYDISGIILSSPIVEIANYYDDYKFMGKNGIPKFDGSVLSSEFINGYGICKSENLVGHQTGQLIRLEDGTYCSQAKYYDERNRIVQCHSTNHLGGSDRMWYAYNFSGEVIKRKKDHSVPGKEVLSEYYTYYYDHAGRLYDVYHQLNENKRIRLIANEHDELGRIENRKVHNLAASTLNYAYNIRSWLMDIKGALFSQNLEYVNSPYATYNGNIGLVAFRYGLEQPEYTYMLEYDRLDRLIAAKYWERQPWNSNDRNFTEKITGYDKNSNILGLQRYGRIGTGVCALIDDLSYSYDGNQLKAVNDTAVYSAYNNGFEFKDGVKLDKEYAYDANGNLTKDLNKKISDIQYNYLNLPSQIKFLDGSTISYVYSADGTKLHTVHKIADTTTTIDYCGNVIYENGIAKCILTEAGYISLNNNDYHYYLQDHQGNNRVVINQTGEIEEINHYYPFGGTFASSSSIQPYKYNGKELDTKNGLNWYDYGARHYDAALGRWHTVDPLAEKYYGISPYVYCVNSPINHVDPDGSKVYFASGVSAQFKQDFAKSVQHLNKYGAAGMLEKLENSDKAYYIAESSNEYSQYNPNNKTITWASRYGILTTNSVILSPTSALNHEVDHALQHDQNPKKQKVDRKDDPSNPYQNKEEERVIKGSEQKTARKLKEIKVGEVTREDHGGTLYEMKSSTSTEIKDELIIKP
ncbi:MAG: RHS repeat-associated core domain-containing protein [Bacteroides xylanisolvens]